INKILIITPFLEKNFHEITCRINPLLNLTFIEGYYTHPNMDVFLEGSDIIVDLTNYGISNKLLVEKCYREGIPLVRCFCEENRGETGIKIFSYIRGREWKELEDVVSRRNIPFTHSDDPVLDLIASGIALEEVKNFLMKRTFSDELIVYSRKKFVLDSADLNICVIGAGALGNFVVLGLIYSGFHNITVMDPDVVEVSNLNRQVLFYDAIGLNKAKAMSEKVKKLWGFSINAIDTYFSSETDISSYNVIFDCVDNFETRITLSEKCRKTKKVLISGGTGMDAGQVIFYDPLRDDHTPAELLGLRDIVEKRNKEEARSADPSCLYQPDPSVIMTNLIIGGLMVDSLRMYLSGIRPPKIFYDSSSNKKLMLLSV
ncbi:MAG: ThiF family adenylyltransferase, partial [Candidatus Aenigmatarchaeota archaeon]